MFASFGSPDGEYFPEVTTGCTSVFAFTNSVDDSRSHKFYNIDTVPSNRREACSANVRPKHSGHILANRVVPKYKFHIPLRCFFLIVFYLITKLQNQK